ncbi:MAG TPA: nucleotidyltransferase domain-containing protein [bacterium]|nr:nucleotidyltransferase domain-containing protein [bacterium]
MDQETKTILSEFRRGLEALYGSRLKHLVLFGSRARGDADRESDIDVLVVLGGSVDAGREISRCGQLMADASLAHTVVISCVFMEEDRFLHRQGPLLRNVRREGIEI